MRRNTSVHGLVLLLALALVPACGGGGDSVPTGETTAMVTGAVRNPAKGGSGIDGAEVSIGSTSTTSAGDGSFALEGIEEGTQTIRVVKVEFEPYEANIAVGAPVTTHDVVLAPDPAVSLEAEALDTRAVSAQVQTGICTFTIHEWSFRLANIPRSTAAGQSAFNDISVTDVQITYDWIDPAATPPRTVGLGGVIVPVDGTNVVEFAPIVFDDLTPGLQGNTANLTLQFNGVTVSGEPVTAIAFRQLHVETCS